MNLMSDYITKTVETQLMTYTHDLINYNSNNDINSITRYCLERK